MSSSRSWRRCCAALVAALASPAGGVRVAIGQDLWSIRNYTARFGAPDAVMSYASIGNLSGLWSPTDYGSGVEYADGALAGLPARTALQLGLELKGHEAALAGGDLDAEPYRVVAEALADPPNAFRVWHSWSFAPWEADGGRGVGAWYPGDGLVDYCGVSVFQQAYGDSNSAI
ncbi:di-heme oxidoreductase [Aureococcus anophagefferens]|nr:di-heme oxidoreductase [Aureococcus anophagefferens]